MEELLGDFREVSERDSVEIEKKENPGRNIVVVCDNEVEKRRESKIPANTKVKYFLGGTLLGGMGRRTQCKS